ncbi:MAG: hypothetical protein M3R57_02815 [Chloroflexota bacterium]|nr:hypothetical protein [Chloroflexota bacterium]
MTARRALPLVAAVAALAVVAAVFLTRTGADQVETGVVLAVDSQSLTDIRGFTLRTTDGRVIDFRIGRLENAVNFPPAHLGVHLEDGFPIRVTFHTEGLDRVAVRLEDILPPA